MPQKVGNSFATVIFIEFIEQRVFTRRKKGKNFMKVSLLPVMRNVMLPSALALLVAAPLISDANADGGRRGRGGRGDTVERRTPPPAHHTNRPGTQMLSQQVNQYLYQGQRLDLIRQLRLRAELDSGKQVLNLQVSAQSTQHRSSLKLIMNGQTVGSLPLGPSMQQGAFTLPPHTYLNDLQLAVVGGAYLGSVNATLGYNTPMPPTGPIDEGRNRLRVDHFQNYQGQSIIPVRRVISDQYPGALMGKKLEKVVLLASSRGGRARAQLLINGMPVGVEQIIPMQETRLRFHLDSYQRNVVGQDIRSIQIELRGNVQTSRLIAVTSESGASYNREVLVNVQRRFLGSQHLSISQLIGYRSDVDMFSQVQSVTIVSSGHGTISLNSRGLSQGSLRVIGGTGTSTINVRDMATLQDLELFVNGRVRIEQLRINLRNGYGY